MLLMQELFCTAQKTVTSLRSMLKKFGIDAIPGENNKSVSTTLNVHLTSDLVLQGSLLPIRVLENYLEALPKQ
jgi:hypothetical protein